MGDTPQPSKAPSGRSGSRSLRAAVVAATEDARRRGQLTAADEPLATLAAKVAGQFDVAAKEKVTSEVVQAGKLARALLADLGLRGESGGGGDHDESTPADDVDAELAELVGSGPTLGNAQNS